MKTVSLFGGKWFYPWDHVFFNVNMMYFIPGFNIICQTFLITKIIIENKNRTVSNFNKIKKYIGVPTNFFKVFSGVFLIN